MDFKLTTPVVFIVFNRPETTIRVFEEIRKAKPEKLLIIADGYRPDRIGEKEKCDAVKTIVSGINWKCEVLRNYSEINLGCKLRISSGLDWAFENVEEAIILEDDCLPDASFFRYCQELLQLYRDNDLIMSIAGQNIQFREDDFNLDYYFSKFVHIWGWATWKRAWNYYDVGIKSWPEYRSQNFFDEIISNVWFRKFTEDMLDRIYKGELDTWDFQWNFCVQSHQGFSIAPSVNLISNIGFGAGATHTKGENIFAGMPVKTMSFPMTGPKIIEQDKEKDARESEINRYSLLYKLPFPIFKMLKLIYYKVVLRK